jgi:hypothetical protein
MATDALDIRMARLEGAYEQINERLGTIESTLASVRTEISSLRIEGKSDLASVRAEIVDLRKQTTAQFYWLLTLVLSSLVLPLARDFLR